MPCPLSCHLAPPLRRCVMELEHSDPDVFARRIADSCAPRSGHGEAGSCRKAKSTTSERDWTM